MPTPFFLYKPSDPHTIKKEYFASQPINWEPLHPHRLTLHTLKYCKPSFKGHINIATQTDKQRTCSNISSCHQAGGGDVSAK